jgi:hypothetical protein
MFLQSLREGGHVYAVEKNDLGFAIIRKPDADPEAFNELARETLSQSGDDFVALPVSDGHIGYEQVVIIPID